MHARGIIGSRPPASSSPMCGGCGGKFKDGQGGGGGSMSNCEWPQESNASDLVEGRSGWMTEATEGGGGTAELVLCFRNENERSLINSGSKFPPAAADRSSAIK